MQHVLTANDWQGVPQFVRVEGKHIQTIAIDGAHEVNLFATAENTYTVTYGLEIKRGLDLEETIQRVGSCIMHALACAGKLD